jgi:Protein of unknown function (DUF2808)
MRQRLFQTSNGLRQVGASLAIAGLLSFSLLDSPARAVRFSDGTIHFAGIPSLGKVSTTDNSAWAWGATYFFALQIPADSSEPLGRIELKKTEGLDSIDFNLKRTFAYVNGDRHQTIDVRASNPAEDTLAIEFDPPVAPGTALTLGLRPYNNPRNGGVYLFGITAFPAGDKVSSQFIGHGRLQFYDRSFFRDGFFGGWWR